MTSSFRNDVTSPGAGDTTPTPVIGDIVHYVSYGTPGGEYVSTCRAAIITEVHELASQQSDMSPVPGHWIVSVYVLNPSGIFFDQRVVYCPGVATYPEMKGARCTSGTRVYRGGTWHWIEQYKGNIS